MSYVTTKEKVLEYCAGELERANKELDKHLKRAVEAPSSLGWYGSIIAMNNKLIATLGQCINLIDRDIVTDDNIMEYVEYLQNSLIMAQINYTGESSQMLSHSVVTQGEAMARKELLTDYKSPFFLAASMTLTNELEAVRKAEKEAGNET